MEINQKDFKLKEIIRELAAEYFSRESNRQSLITITDVEVYNRGGTARILMTVLPESAETAALEFARRQLTEFRQHVTQHSRIGRVPFFDIAIDVGEKNRQRIDEVSKTL
jgi:ribosome-binding factor A